MHNTLAASSAADASSKIEAESRTFWQRLKQLSGMRLGEAEGSAETLDLRSPAQIAQQALDEHVDGLLADGDVDGAIGIAYEAQRLQPDDLAARKRYHRALLRSPAKISTMTANARIVIDMLVERSLGSEALKVYYECRQLVPDFSIDDPEKALALARIEWRSGNSKPALALLTGFDKRFKGHETIPQAYELAARVLVQGLGRKDMVRAILRTLENRYPESEQTAEVRWLMRDLPKT